VCRVSSFFHCVNTPLRENFTTEILFWMRPHYSNDTFQTHATNKKDYRETYYKEHSFTGWHQKRSLHTVNRSPDELRSRSFRSLNPDCASTSLDAFPEEERRDGRAVNKKSDTARATHEGVWFLSCKTQRGHTSFNTVTIPNGGG